MNPNPENPRTPAARRPWRASALACLLAAASPLAWSQGAPLIDKGDTSFMKQAAQHGHAEVATSRLALERSGDAAVKAFAKQMVDDHTRAGQELAKLAAAKGVDLPDEPSTMQQGKIKLLGRIEGRNFDTQYADDYGVKAHESTVMLFEKAEANVKDADLKAWVAKTLPTLRQHLHHAYELKRQTAPKP